MTKAIENTNPWLPRRAGAWSMLPLVGCVVTGPARDGVDSLGGDTSAGSGLTSGGSGASTDDGGTGGSGGSADSTGDEAEGDSGAPELPPPPDRGANLPYWEYEAEDAATNAVIIGPSRAFGEIPAEASGRRAVRLESTGDHVTFAVEHPMNSIVVRYVIPDAPAGGGIEATLGLYVDGVRAADLELTSRYAWIYGGESNSENNTPGEGAHHFFDEVRLLIDEVQPGSTVTLQRDPGDDAAYYVIDLVDFELVAPPLDPPADSVSITDHGATSDDGTDDGPAIQAAIAAAQASGREVWIPAGTFHSATQALETSGVTVRGAGMWHSNLRGERAMFRVSGDNNRFYDFAVTAEVTRRDDLSPDNAFDGPAGTGSRMERVWIEHVKVGWWVGKGAFPGVPAEPLTDGLIVSGVRIRNTFADGINLCNGTSHSVVEQSHLRNTGDDALATWSPTFDGPSAVGNTFRFNTVQLPWRANCYALYGGTDLTIEDSVCADTVVYPGVLVATTGAFSPHPFGGTTQVRRTTLTRTGGPMYGQEHGALKLFADANALTDVVVEDLRIEDSTFSGIHVQGPSDLSSVDLSMIEIEGTATAGIHVEGNAQGSASASHVVVSGAAQGGLRDDSPGTFVFLMGDGNSGW